VRLQCNVLSQDEIERVHDLSLHILERTGIVINNPAALHLLRGHGASIDGARDLVRIPRALVEQAIALAPRAVTLYSQNDGRKDCVLGVSGGQYARTSTGLNWIMDAGALARRPVMEADAVAWTRVAHALPNISVVGSAYDQEGSPNAMEVRALERMLRHTDKPLMVSALSGEGMRWVQRLCEVTQAGDRLPRVVVLSSVNSPLTYGFGQVEAAMVAAELGIPVFYNSSAVAGVGAPTTLAGSVAQMNAEMLAALTIIQLHCPGAQVVHSAHPLVLDMQNGLARIGGAEVGLMAAACVDIGRFYGLPTASNGLGAESCSADAMAVADKFASGYLAVLSGANLNGAAGAIGSQGIISLEQLVIDDDIYGGIFHQRRGIAVDEETLASDVIEQVGPGGSFLEELHTLRHFRAELRDSRLANRLTAPAWTAAGSKDVLARAREMARDILAAPEERFLTDEQTRELRVISARASSALIDLEIPI
jgi:trimethylamine--corrinoid protein Co-methyltransferase